MDCIYRNRKYIARLVLVHLAFVFLLSLNFKVWSGTYLEGSLEDIVVTQSNELNHCLLIHKDTQQTAEAAIGGKRHSDIV